MAGKFKEARPLELLLLPICLVVSHIKEWTLPGLSLDAYIASSFGRNTRCVVIALYGFQPGHHKATLGNDI